MKLSLKKVLLFGLLVGLIVAAWQWRAILGFYMDFSVRRVTKSLPKCDRIEVFHLTGNEPDGLIAVDASNGFPVRPYNNYARIRGQTTLAGADATAFASLWRAQTFGWDYQALCHQPAYGFRYYSGSKLIYETSICFKCSNFYYPVFGDAGWHGFDTESTEAKEYLAKLQELFPDSVPLSKADARPSEGLIASMKRAKDSVKAGDLAGGTRQQREILRDTLASIDPSAQSITDTVVVCYVTAEMAEFSLDRGERELAKALCQDAIEGLRRCQVTMPDWHPKIVSYRIKRADELRARIH